MLIMTLKSGNEKSLLRCHQWIFPTAINRMEGGANSVISIDSSSATLAVRQRNMMLNSFDQAKTQWRDTDVFKTLRTLLEQGKTFDLIILDPPKFVSASGQVDRAARAYKDINPLGLRLLREDGLLFTYSCSGAINADLFQKIIAGVDMKILRRLPAIR